MPTIAVHTEFERRQLIKQLAGRKLPFTAIIYEGRRRSVEQNRLQHLWIKEAAEQLQEYTPEQYRAYCKLHFAVPILRNDDEQFRGAYDRVIRPLPYDLKLEAMAIPLDFPCTRLMNVEQKSRYLDAMHEHFTGLGVILTEPEERW